MSFDVSKPMAYQKESFVAVLRFYYLVVVNLNISAFKNVPNIAMPTFFAFGWHQNITYEIV